MLGSIGPTELILFLMIAGSALFFYFSYRWSSRKSKAAALAKPFRWFYFYTYIRLPLAILANIMVLIVLRNIDLVPIGVAIIGLQIAVLLGLSKFRVWALNLNIPLMLGEVYLYYSNMASRNEASNESQLVPVPIIFPVIWLLLNVFYFEKRRRFFVGPAFPGRIDEGPESEVGDDGTGRGDKKVD